MCSEKQVDMSKGREKQHPASPGNVSCSICLEMVERAGDRSVARLKCGHYFHLDCIGSAFNAKGAMQCPNCRQVEAGQWLFAGGCLLQQHHLLTSANRDEESNTYGGIHVNVVHHDDNERHYAHMSRRSHGGAYHHMPAFYEDNAYRLASSRWGTEATPWNVPIDDISRMDTLDASLSYGAATYSAPTIRPIMPRVHGWARRGSRLPAPPDVRELPITRERSDEEGMLFSYGASAGLTSGHRYGPNRGVSDRGSARDLHVLPQSSLSNLEQQHRMETGVHDARYGLLDGIPYNSRRVPPYPSHTGLGYDLRREVHPYDPSRPFSLTYNGSIPSLNRAMDSRAYGSHHLEARNLRP